MLREKTYSRGGGGGEGCTVSGRVCIVHWEEVERIHAGRECTVGEMR